MGIEEKGCCCLFPRWHSPGEGAREGWRGHDRSPNPASTAELSPSVTGRDKAEPVSLLGSLFFFLQLQLAALCCKTQSFPGASVIAGSAHSSRRWH